MAKVMMTIHAPEGTPSLQEISSKFGLELGEIDEDFGVVAIDPERNDYTILVEQGATQKIKANEHWDVSGPYSNPRIETFGLPES
jgi:hypothetical protein